MAFCAENDISYESMRISTINLIVLDYIDFNHQWKIESIESMKNLNIQLQNVFPFNFFLIWSFNRDYLGFHSILLHVNSINSYKFPGKSLKYQINTLYSAIKHNK